MNNIEERKALTRERDDREKETSESDPLNTFEIIQFESNRTRPTSKNKYTTIIIFCVFIVLIAVVTLYFLNKSDSIFNQDVKLFKLKIRKKRKANENSKETKKEDEEKKRKRKEREKKREKEREKREKKKKRKKEKKRRKKEREKKREG